MLKRMQHYAQVNPLQTWVRSTAFLLTFNLTGYFLVPGTRNMGLLAFFAGMGIWMPTFALVQRCSEERRRTYPVPPEQEAQIGLLSVLFACGSIGLLALLVVGKRMGLAVSADVGVGLLFLYALFALLAVAFGYAARYTQTGLFGFKLAVGWLMLLLVTGYALLLLHRP